MKFSTYLEMVGSGTGSIGGPVMASGDRGQGSSVAQYWNRVGSGKIQKRKFADHVSLISPPLEVVVDPQQENGYYSGGPIQGTGQ